ncbi:MAG: tRNA (adenosine(37)-N6)-threonylcarbamoyltransferase complex ATPase subunit type 1 TsaE [Bacteroidota bacterium]
MSGGFLITNFHLICQLKVNDYFRAVEMGTWQVHSLEDLDAAAVGLLKTFPKNQIFAFFGNMGSGKTTFIKSLCKTLGVNENVSSPTFALVNEYLLENGNPVYHFDFYRIEKEQEALYMGINEYFNSGHYCFIEWSEKILHLLPEDAVRVHITSINKTRIITTENG